MSGAFTRASWGVDLIKVIKRSKFAHAHVIYIPGPGIEAIAAKDGGLGVWLISISLVLRMMIFKITPWRSI